MLLARGDVLEPEDFPESAMRPVMASMELPAEGLELVQVERALVLRALERTGWNKTHAGRLLGLNREQIHYRIQKFGLAHK